MTDGLRDVNRESSDLENLANRLQALEDERSIRRTLLQYAHVMDQRESKTPRDLSDCFTENGVWWVSIDGPFAGKGGSRHEGRQEIEEFFQSAKALEDAKPEPRAKRRHYLVSPEITVEGDRATVESYHLGVAASQQGPILTSMCRYLDQLIRCSDGRWRIQERHICKEGDDVDGQGRSTF